MTKDEEKQLRHILKSVLVRAEAPAAETDSTLKMAQSVLDNCWRAGSRATSERMISELKDELRGWKHHHLKNEGKIRILEARVSVLKSTIANLQRPSADASPSSLEPQSEVQEQQPLSAGQSSQVSEPSVSQ